MRSTGAESSGAHEGASTWGVLNLNLMTGAVVVVSHKGPLTFPCPSTEEFLLQELT
jgi:hypothetical protein